MSGGVCRGVGEGGECLGMMSWGMSYTLSLYSLKGGHEAGTGSLQVEDGRVVKPVRVGLRDEHGGGGGDEPLLGSGGLHWGAVLGAVHWGVMGNNRGRGGDGATLLYNLRAADGLGSWLVLGVSVDGGPQVAQVVLVQSLHADDLVSHAWAGPPQNLDPVAVLLDVGVEAVEEAVRTELLASRGAVFLQQLVAEVVAVLVRLKRENLGEGVVGAMAGSLGHAQGHAGEGHQHNL